MSVVIWDLDTDKVINRLKEGKRIDERAFDEYREIKLQKQISENADGSARVQLGETDIIAGVKFELGKPYPDTPEEGTMSVNSELLPLASPTFEFGPPSVESVELARVADRGIRESKCIDFKSLCIRENELAYTANIDIYVVNYAGNLFDASAFAAIAALVETKLPKVEEDKLVPGEYSGKLKLSRKPILSTFAKIANSIVLDPNLAEEKAMNSRFSVSTTEDELLCAFQKGLGGSFTSAELSGMLDIALKKGKELRKLL